MVLNVHELVQIHKSLPIPNRTFAYLTPSIALVDPDLMARIISIQVSVIGFYIGDTSYMKSDLDNEPVIFMAINTTVQPFVLYNHLFYIRNSKFYVTEYSYQAKDTILILVIKTDERAYLNFLTGKYSKMYDPQVLEDLPFPLNKSGALNVFKRDQVAKAFFCKLLETTFKTENINIEDLDEDAEYELPPIYSDSTRDFEIITI